MLRCVTALLSLVGAVCAIAERPSDPVWPETFHIVAQQHRGVDLAIVDLYYDYPRGGNLNLIRSQGGEADGPLYDMERSNGTGYYYTPKTKECKVIDFGVGLLPPDWLAGAEYLGTEPVGQYTCHKWQKGDSDIPSVPFVVYWDEVLTRRPVKWVFSSGMSFDVISYAPHEPTNDALWQIPAYCFDKTAVHVERAVDSSSAATQ